MDSVQARFATNAPAGSGVPEPVAVIGIGCRFPGGATDPDSYWRLLCDGVDAVSETPPDRWNLDHFYFPDSIHPGKTQSRWGGYVADIDRFDPQFFGISPKEASNMDPQQRMLLEVAWRSLEDAGQPIGELVGRPVGVYVGISSFDYAVAGLSFQDRGAIGPYSNTGGSSSIASNRISYCFDFRGPSIAVDTACSSSLVALHLACESLYRGECEMALAGGVNALLLPDFYVGFSQLGVLSPDGRCKTFDRRANGYVRAEGAGMVLLKPLRQALHDHDPIYCVIRATSTNQDGHTPGMTVPSRGAQNALVRNACQKAGIDPSEVQYVEAHGTGTPVGDPIEAGALSDVLCADRDPSNPCWIGSVKTNIGHLEAGAGIASLIKVALAVHHGTIPAHLHLSEPNPEIDFEALNIYVPRTTQPWPETSGPRVAGVNSFGYGGANAHALVQQAPVISQSAITADSGQPNRKTDRRSLILPVSARTSAALEERSLQFADWLSDLGPDASMVEIAASAAHRHSHFDHRIGVIGESVDDWAQQLRSAAVQTSEPVGTSTAGHGLLSGDFNRQLMFVCCGQGTQWWAMGKGMYRSDCTYREIIDRCDREFSQYADWSLKDELLRKQCDSRMHETSIAQPALFALQVALAKAWAGIGVCPAIIIGHSVGEIAASYISGALSFEDACLVAFERGRTMDLASSHGAMVAAGLSAQDAYAQIEALGADVSVAAINGPSTVTLSGEASAVEIVAQHLESQGTFCKRLSVEYAFHSRQMDPVRDDLLKSLSRLRPKQSRMQMISTVTGKPISGEELDGNYWWQNVRQSVQFAGAIMEAATQGVDAAIELGPHPILSYAIKECCHEVGRSVEVVPSLRRDEADEIRFPQSIAKLYGMGADLRWDGLYDRPTSLVRLPSYPFQTQSLWAESEESRQTRLASSHPTLGQRRGDAAPSWNSRIDLDVQTSLRDHCVRGNCMLPAAAMIETAAAAVSQLAESETVVLSRFRCHRPCMLGDDRPLELQTRYDVDRCRLQITSRPIGTDDWSQLASTVVVRDPVIHAPLAKSVDEVLARCQQSVNLDQCYDFCARLGLDYGPAYRGLARGWRRDGEAFAEIELPSSGEVAGYDDGIHPALLDSCFHAMIVADAEFDHTIDGLYLPREIDRIEILRPATDRLTVHVRLLEKTRHRLLADLDIRNHTGETCIQIRGFVGQRAGKGLEEESLADWLYCYRWTESELEDEGIVSIGESSTQLWMVFADQSRLSDALIEDLGDRGGRVVRIDHGTSFEHIGSDHYILDPTRKPDFERLLHDATGSLPGAQIHFAYLWGLDTPNPASLDADKLRCSTCLTTLAPMYLTQAWSVRGSSSASRFTLLTAGAQADDIAIAPVSVAQLPLIGFGRVMISECSDLRARLVDLPPDATERCDASLLRSLVGELTNAVDPEDEIMYRNGQRFAHRFVPQLDQPMPADAIASAHSQLSVGGGTGIDDLHYRSQSSPRLGANEVEIEVAASGLNFSDVMKTLNLYPGLEGAPGRLGAECSGRVTRVGAEVTQWSTGDEVIAVAPGSFSTHAIADAHLVARKPTQLTHAQAATIPIAFLTAAYALEDCARISEGDSVLIHAASGGVGLAAIQFARMAGATIYATAGSDEKREFVRNAGAEMVMDSRSLMFADQIMAATSGEGVDIVLNSLPGEAITRGLESLKIGGRFLEIGKRDIYDDTALGMLPFRNNLALFAIDLDQLFKSQPQRIGKRLREIAEQFERGVLQPIPIESWDADQSQAAFRHMQQAKHIGKVAIEYDQKPSTVFAGESNGIEFSSTGTHWVVGGLGGFGLELAKWLAQHGARTLVLSGRSRAIRPEARSVISELEAAGVSVHVIPMDVTDADEVTATADRIGAELPPLRSVIHAAMVLDDCLLADLDRALLEKVLFPKVLGGWNLHQATVDRKLDHFILFSSLSSVFGHAGQANYSAANALLDGLAHYRRGVGLPGCVINWGHLGEVGYLAERPELGDRLERQGVLSFSISQAMQSLEYVLTSRAIQTSVLRMDWSLWRGLGTTNVSPRFAHLMHRRKKVDAEVASAEEIRDASPERRRELVDEMLTFKVSSLLGFHDGELDRRRSLLELGLDSLMAVELRNWVESKIQITLPISEVMRDVNFGELTDRICELVTEEDQQPTAARDDANPTDSSAPIDSIQAQGLLESLPDMPSEEISQLLAKMLREQGPAADDAS